MNNISTIPADIAISVQELAIALLLGTIMSLILQWHYNRFSLSTGNRSQFSSIFLYIVLTVTLIISLIKSSFALSLGLIGALSIVRFRTPIKDPEELAYLFMAIAIGLGLGAKQLLPTGAAFLVILSVTAVVRKAHNKVKPGQLLLNVTLDNSQDANQKVEQIKDALKQEAQEILLKRIDQYKDQSHLLFTFSLENRERENDLLIKIKDSVGEGEYSLVNQDQII